MNRPRSADIGGLLLATAGSGHGGGWLGHGQELDPLSGTYFAELLSDMYNETMHAVQEPQESLSFISEPMEIPREMREKLVQALDEWEFEPHKLQDEDEVIGCTMILFEALFRIQGMREDVGITLDQIYPLIHHLRLIYRRETSYHNFEHALDVLQASYIFLRQAGIVPSVRIVLEDDQTQLWRREQRTGLISCLQNSDIFVLYIAAIGHDVAHPGITNGFMKNASAPLSQVYDDKSPLENLHCSVLLRVMRHHKLGNLLDESPLAKQQRRQSDYIKDKQDQDEENSLGTPNCGKCTKSIRKLLYETVLATDMSVHQGWMIKFRGMLDDIRRSGGVEEKDEHKDDEDEENWKRRVLTCQAIIKSLPRTHFGLTPRILFPHLVFSSHLSPSFPLSLLPSSTSRPFPISRHWSTALMSEWSSQASLERCLGLPCTVQDKDDPYSEAKSQIFFGGTFVKPLWEVLIEGIPELQPFLDQCNSNLATWHQRQAELESEAAQAEVHTQASPARSTPNSEMAELDVGSLSGANSATQADVAVDSNSNSQQSSSVSTSTHPSSLPSTIPLPPPSSSASNSTSSSSSSFDDSFTSASIFSPLSRSTKIDDYATAFPLALPRSACSLGIGNSEYFSRYHGWCRSESGENGSEMEETLQETGIELGSGGGGGGDDNIDGLQTTSVDGRGNGNVGNIRVDVNVNAVHSRPISNATSATLFSPGGPKTAKTSKSSKSKNRHGRHRSSRSSVSHPNKGQTGGKRGSGHSRSYSKSSSYAVSPDGDQYSPDSESETSTSFLDSFSGDEDDQASESGESEYHSASEWSNPSSSMDLRMSGSRSPSPSAILVGEGPRDGGGERERRIRTTSGMSEMSVVSALSGVSGLSGLSSGGSQASTGSGKAGTTEGSLLKKRSFNGIGGLFKFGGKGANGNATGQNGTSSTSPWALRNGAGQAFPGSPNRSYTPVPSTISTTTTHSHSTYGYSQDQAHAALRAAAESAPAGLRKKRSMLNRISWSPSPGEVRDLDKERSPRGPMTNGGFLAPKYSPSPSPSPSLSFSPSLSPSPPPPASPSLLPPPPPMSSPPSFGSYAESSSMVIGTTMAEDRERNKVQDKDITPKKPRQSKSNTGSRENVIVVAESQPIPALSQGVEMMDEAKAEVSPV
ncbi:HD-domain/PDEase-like protein [Dendrothele bispora CBS 962.96]|uniref:Phosphodiesterase n=1 Tax=Dendrothele bispora (strain CBS 962.96) TaxID=1314807 RepID=A0A4S8MPH2_DENBC|nr:HD-domain/PDEase-like protein [Dendrothele bispora CBS 962.96]